MEKTLIQYTDDCDIFLLDAQSADRAIAGRDCPYQSALDDFLDYFANPFYYILRGREQYLEDWMELYENIGQWLVENK